MAPNPTDIVILEGARTPMAEYNGALRRRLGDRPGGPRGPRGPRAQRGRAGRDRPRHLRQRHADLGRRDLRRPARRPEGGRSQGGPGAHRQPAVRLGLRVDRPGRPAHPAGRGEDRPGRRHGEHVAGAARHPRRAQGLRLGPGPARGFPDGRAARLLLRALHGADLRPGGRRSTASRAPEQDAYALSLAEARRGRPGPRAASRRRSCPSR